MTIRHLEIFIAVADYGKMSIAAEKLFISQPSVSQAISEIEKYYGVKLFERLSRKLYITENGKKLLNYARHIVSNFKEMEGIMKNAGDKVVLNIGGTVTVGTCILSPLVKKYEKNYEGASVKVIVNNTTVIEKMLLESSLDLAITEGEIHSKDIIKLPLIKDELVVICGLNHPMAGAGEIELEALANKDFIGREQGSRDRNAFEQYLLEKGIGVNVKWSCTNTEAIKNAVMSGQGLAILSKLVIIKELQKKMLHVVPIKGIKIQRDICLVYHKDKFLSEQLKAFIEVSKSLQKNFTK